MKVTMKKAKLLEVLEANMKEHVELYEEAKKGYVEDAKKGVKLVAKLLKQTGDLHTSPLNLVKPVSYEESYKEAIQMLKYTDEDVIELEEDEFRQYVLDKWGWGNQFKGSNARYLSQTSVTKMSAKY